MPSYIWILAIRLWFPLLQRLLDPEYFPVNPYQENDHGGQNNNQSDNNSVNLPILPEDVGHFYFFIGLTKYVRRRKKQHK
jgi:hypothetical protein